MATEYLISWDTDGVEAIVPIGKQREENIAAKLAGERTPHPDAGMVLERLSMRARFNPQRSPQVWGIIVNEDITEETLNDLADNQPQELVNVVRKHGVKLYGFDQQKSKLSY